MKFDGPIYLNDRHIIPQVSLIPDDIDFIGRFENIIEDFNTMCDKIGMGQQTLPHKHYRTYKHINKGVDNHYTEYYNKETKDIVTKMYREDLEVFGYKYGK